MTIKNAANFSVLRERALFRVRISRLVSVGTLVSCYIALRSVLECTSIVRIQSNGDLFENIPLKVLNSPSADTGTKRIWTLTFQSPHGGAFVHLGKTGGSTISVVLRNGCHSFLPHPCRNVTNETIASKLVQSYYHVPDFGLLKQGLHDFYLVSTRDPLDRFVSSFVYEHFANRLARGESMDPKNIQKLQDAYSCFPTLEAFVSFLDSNEPIQFEYPYPQNTVRNENCQDLARAALYGKVRIYGHLFFGYGRIRSFLMSSSNQPLTIYVTRQEHLQEDWVAVNRRLGQASAVLSLPHQRNLRNTTLGPHTMPVSRRLSLRGKRLLCRALTGEYKAYLWFLRQARNLSPEDVSESIRYSMLQCPQLTLLLLQEDQEPNKHNF
jgi:hypothetical protein